MAVNFIRNAADYLLRGPAVGGASEERLRRWFALPPAQLALPHARARYVVIDTETSGGVLRHNRLVAIGAAGVDRMCLDLADCFTAVLRQERRSAERDILRHGIGGQAQLVGVLPQLAILDFLDYLGKAPLVAFQAGSDSAIVERAVMSILGVPFRHPWIDLAALLQAQFPKAGCASLDEWLHHFGLATGTWRDALGSAFATAQLLQVTLDASTRAGIVNAAQLIAAAHAARRPGRR